MMTASASKKLRISSLLHNTSEDSEANHVQWQHRCIATCPYQLVQRHMSIGYETLAA